ncbi:MAG: Z1 domain-containing protein [Clostridia bacterium]|nr:Z1 domain-containing protein [Clostridia bacterium]
MKNLIKIIPVKSDKVVPIISDGEFIQNVSDYMSKNDFPQKSIDNIIQNSVDVFSQCVKPIEQNKSNTGIIIGKVQSGKTSNFIALMAMAFDNGYKITIVLGGNKNILLAQNKQRINDSFNLDSSKLVILDTNTNSDIINEREIERFIRRGVKVIIVGLKHYKHIDKIAEVFSSLYLRNQTTLIIDDEGDQATLNTKKYSKKETFPSAIYNSVKRLREKLNKHTFVSVTATPQANMLIDSFDILSPDFGQLIEPSLDYCGLADFHSAINEDNYVNVIPEAEPSIFDISGMPASYEKAMAMFFVSNGIRKYRGDYGNHAILFHPSVQMTGHEIVRNKVQELLDFWQLKADLPEDIAFGSLRKILTAAYNEYKDGSVVVPKYSELEPFIIDSIRGCSSVMVCNSNTDASENSRHYKTNIFVGGNMVERGLTIKGLAITYLIRRAKGVSNVDNTEQRARWFGYKRDYLDICRVFTTKQIKKDFNNIYEHDEALWDTIQKHLKAGKEFKDIPRVFLNNSKLLRLTRANVAREARCEYWQIRQQDSLIMDAQVEKNNLALLESLKQTYVDKCKIYKFGAYNHFYVEDVEYKKLVEMVLSKFSFPSQCNFDQKFFSNLAEIFRLVKESPLIDVVFMRYDNLDIGFRSIDSNGNIETGLMIGHTNNYVGDRKIPDCKANTMQLQVHMIKPKGSNVDYFSPCFALYLPPRLSEKISKFVKRGEVI